MALARLDIEATKIEGLVKVERPAMCDAKSGAGMQLAGSRARWDCRKRKVDVDKKNPSREVASGLQNNRRRDLTVLSLHLESELFLAVMPVFDLKFQSDSSGRV